jgi:Mn2+/Fe2+ NRAMP family transporter
VTAAATVTRTSRHRWGHLLGILGPGLVTGAADDDPSGIATYSQTGAQFGYGQLWTALWMLPLVAGVQEACGRIGNVTGQGLSRNIKDHYSLRTLRLLVALLAVANIINIGADIGALGASAALIIPVPATALMVIFTLLILSLENFIGVNPVRALVFAAVFNGVAAIPLLIFIDRLAASRKVMGKARSGWMSRFLLAVTILGMTGAVAAMAISAAR